MEIDQYTKIPRTIGGADVVSVVVRQVDDSGSDLLLSSAQFYYVLSNGAIVSAQAEFGEGVSIGFGCFVGDAEIGNNVTLHPFSRVQDVATVCDGVQIGKHTIVGIGCSIGDSAVIGDSCYIGYENHLPSGTRLPDNTILPLEVVRRGDAMPEFDKDHIVTVFHGEHIQLVEVPSGPTVQGAS